MLFSQKTKSLALIIASTMISVSAHAQDDSAAAQ